MSYSSCSHTLEWHLWSRWCDWSYKFATWDPLVGAKLSLYREASHQVRFRLLLQPFSFRSFSFVYSLYLYLYLIILYLLFWDIVII
jgi:hypothetical protein